MSTILKKYIAYLILCAFVVGCASSRAIKSGDVSDSGQPEGETTSGQMPDSASVTALFSGDSLLPIKVSSLEELVGDSLGAGVNLGDSAVMVGVLSDSTKRINDSLTKANRKPFLDAVMTGKNTDSVTYDVKTKVFQFYEKGDITYQDKNIKADYMLARIDDKLILAYGREDTVIKGNTRVEFVDGKSPPITMDSLRYNLGSGIADIKGSETQDGETFLRGSKVKKMPDNTLYMKDGRLSTCNLHDPHFFIGMNRAKVIPDKKVIGYGFYLNMEGVNLPIWWPFAFFPLSSEKSSGVIVPSFGEESTKGFYLREGGYYLKFNDYIDLALTAGIYTFGSWEAQAASNYIKRYTYSGDFNVNFAADIIGEKGSDDYVNQQNFKLRWSHRQDPKWNPSSTFSASVNFSTSGYSKYSSTTMNDYLSTQTNSSIAYSKSWVGKPFTLSTNLQHSQNARDTTVSLSFPNAVFNVSRIHPFKRREAQGKERWYEKISMSYTGTLQNSVTAKEYELFKPEMFDKMKNGVNHVIPIQASFNLFGVINLTPSANYQERWYFQKIERKWDSDKNMTVAGDTTAGFYRLYDYRFSMGMSTNVYGIYLAKQSSESRLRGIRHVITPSASFSYAPNFSKPSYGYYEQVQSSADGKTTSYSPYQQGIFGVPSSGQNASLSFSVQQNLAIKLRNKNDTVERKVNIIENLNVSSSYNFLADSLNLAPFQISFRTTIAKGVALNVSASLDPYQIDQTGRKINKFSLSNGSLGRLTSASTTFGYEFRSSKDGDSKGGAMNSINSHGNQAGIVDNETQSRLNQMDANTRRQVMTSGYYDFAIPWNFGFNYSFNYSKPGKTSSVMQTLGFQGSVTLTQKWGLNFNGGYDFKEKKLTPGTVSISRDLHCWQMHFNWVPLGFRKSWSFTIGVNSQMLSDLKLDKNSSFYDNLYE